MSGVAKGIKKVFKAVGSVIKKIWKPLMIAVAVYFTAGMALAAFAPGSTFLAAMPGFGGIAGTSTTAAGATATAGTTAAAEGAAGIAAAETAGAAAVEAAATTAANTMATAELGSTALTEATANLMASEGLATAGINSAAISGGLNTQFAINTANGIGLTANSAAAPGVFTKMAAKFGFDSAQQSVAAAGQNNTWGSIGMDAAKGVGNAIKPSNIANSVSGMSTSDKLLLAATASNAIGGLLDDGPYQGSTYFGVNNNAGAKKRAQQAQDSMQSLQNAYETYRPAALGGQPTSDSAGLTAQRQGSAAPAAPQAPSAPGGNPYQLTGQPNAKPRLIG
jgi:hypothetical protein